MLQVKNLEPPHGQCREHVDLDYFEYYSIPACLLNCKEEFLVGHCGCRDVYMPLKQNGNLKVLKLILLSDIKTLI